MKFDITVGFKTTINHVNKEGDLEAYGFDGGRQQLMSFVYEHDSNKLGNTDKDLHKAVREYFNEHKDDFGAIHSSDFDLDFTISNLVIKKVMRVKPTKPNKLKKRPMYGVTSGRNSILGYRNISTGAESKCVYKYLEENYGYSEIYLKEWFIKRYHFMFPDYDYGVTPDQLHVFCKEHDIPVTMCDLDCDVLYRWSGSNRNKRALIYICANGHLYTVEDDKIRCRIRATELTTKFSKNFKTVLNSIPVKRNPRELKQLPANLEEIKPNINYYTSDPLNRVFVYLLSINKEIPYERSRKDSVIFVSTDDNQFYSSVNIEDCLRLARLLKVDFRGQTYTYLVRSAIKKFAKFEFNASDLNSVTYENIKNVFQSTHAPMSFVTTSYDEEEMKELYRKDMIQAFDCDKQYANIIKKHNLPVFNLDSNMMKFKLHDLTSEDMFYVKTDNVFPFNKTNWYYGFLVNYGIDNGIITVDDIKYVIKHSSTSDTMKHLQEAIYKSDLDTKDKKYIVNIAIGILGKKHNKDSSHTRYTTDAIDAMYYRTKNDNNKVKEIAKIDGESLYQTICYKDSINPVTTRPAYLYIIQRGYLETYKLWQLILKTTPTAELLQVKTDCVYSLIKSKQKKWKPVEGYHKEIKQLISTTKRLQKYNTPPELSRIPDARFYNEIDASKCKSSLSLAPGGYGKSYQLKKLAKTLIEKYSEDEVAIVAFTNKACSRVGGRTFHNAFGVDKDDNASVDPEKYRAVLVDEVSMIGAKLHKFLLMCKENGAELHLFGDYNQLPPVDDIRIDTSSRYLKWLTDNVQIKYDKCYRTDLKFAKIQQRVASGILPDDFYDDKKVVKTSIVYRHVVRNSVNKSMAKLYGDKGDVGSRIVLKYKYNGLNNNDIFEVVDNKTDLVLKYKFDNNQVDTVTIDESKKEDFLDRCWLGYALTCYMVQGGEIDEPYRIYEWDYSREHAFTAISRATKREYPIIAGHFRPEIEEVEDCDMSAFMDECESQ